MRILYFAFGVYIPWRAARAVVQFQYLTEKDLAESIEQTIQEKISIIVFVNDKRQLFI